MKYLKWAALPLAGILGLTLMAPAPAQASNGRAAAAAILGGVAGYGIAKGNPTVAGLGAAGALIALTSGGHHHHRRRFRRVVYVPVREHYYHGGWGYRHDRGRHRGWGHRW